MIGERIGTFKGLEVREVWDKDELIGTAEDNCIYKFLGHLYFREQIIAKVSSGGNVYDFRENRFKRLLVMEKPNPQKEVPVQVAVPRARDVEAYKPEPQSPLGLDIDKVLRDSRSFTVADLIGEFNYELS